MQTKLTKEHADQRRGEAREAAVRRGEIPTAPAGLGGRSPAQNFQSIDAIDDFIYPAATPANKGGAGNNDDVVLMDTTPVAEEAEMSKEEAFRYDAIYEALLRLRDEIAELKSRQSGKVVKNYVIASEALLQALARAAPASLDALKNLKFTDATWNGFIRQHHQKIWDTMSKTRKLLDNPELMADIGAASANFEEFEYVATQQRDGPGLGVKRSGGDVEADVGWQKAKR